MAENGMRLIDANELDGKLEALAQKYTAQGRPEVAKDYSFVQIILLTARTVDAAEVVHGRWKAYPDFRQIVCTNCLMEFSLIHMPYIRNYCPNCGAKMDSDAAEQPEECT